MNSALTGTLIVTVGPAGAGKTTWRGRHAPADAVAVSLDELRARFSPCGCSGDHSVNRVATEHGLTLTRTALADGGTVVWDITAYRAESRRHLLDVAADHHAHAIGVILLPPLHIALARNVTRDSRVCPICGTARRVPDHVIAEMHRAITADLPRLAFEGWNDLIHLPDDCSNHPVVPPR